MYIYIYICICIYIYIYICARLRVRCMRACAQAQEQAQARLRRHRCPQALHRQRAPAQAQARAMLWPFQKETIIVLYGERHRTAKQRQYRPCLAVPWLSQCGKHARKQEFSGSISAASFSQQRFLWQQNNQGSSALHWQLNLQAAGISRQQRFQAYPSQNFKQELIMILTKKE